MPTGSPAGCPAGSTRCPQCPAAPRSLRRGGDDIMLCRLHTAALVQGSPAGTCSLSRQPGLLPLSQQWTLRKQIVSRGQGFQVLFFGTKITRKKTKQQPHKKPHSTISLSFKKENLAGSTVFQSLTQNPLKPTEALCMYISGHRRRL